MFWKNEKTQISVFRLFCGDGWSLNVSTIRIIDTRKNLVTIISAITAFDNCISKNIISSNE